MNIRKLNQYLGNIDLYLLDQILKNNIPKHSKILDAGCGEGRNLIYFLNNEYDVSGIDQNPEAIAMLHFILRSSYPYIPKSNFQAGKVENLPYSEAAFDWIISSAVLHFSESTSQFWASMNEMSRVLKSGGVLFIRMTSDIGIKPNASVGNGIYSLPDGSHRFLLSEKMISQIKEDLGYEDLEPTKSVLVDGLRSMSTLVLQKK